MSQFHVLGKGGDIAGYLRVGILADAALIRIDVEQPGATRGIYRIRLLCWHWPRL
jgi:hypothetical protein